MGSDYTRTTRACTFAELRPELAEGLRAHARKYDLGDLALGAVACCETISEKKKRGLFGGLLGGDPDPVHYTGVVLTPTHLLWVRSGPKSGTVAASARLSDLEIRTLPAIPATVALADDLRDGLTVFGFINDSSERVSAFIGLGSEADARMFRETVEVAIAKARNE
jgi:hypothetical protein